MICSKASFAWMASTLSTWSSVNLHRRDVSGGRNVAVLTHLAQVDHGRPQCLSSARARPMWMMPPPSIAIRFLRRVQGNDLAVVDDRHPVAEPLGFFHVVGGVEDGHARSWLSRSTLSKMWLRLCGSTPTVGSSRKRMRGPVEQSGGQVDAPLHTARVGLHRVIGPLRSWPHSPAPRPPAACSSLPPKPNISPKKADCPGH